jgi:hypothetical protein
MIYVSQKRNIDGWISNEELGGVISSKKQHTPMNKGTNIPFDGKRTPESKPLTTKPYRQLLGKLMHSTQTRPDIQTAVNILATRSNIAEEKDWDALVTIRNYLAGTATYRLALGKRSNTELVAYADSSYCTEIEWKSRAGGVQLMYGSVVGHFTKVMKPTPQSTAEAELMAESEQLKLTLFTRQFLEELRSDKLSTTTIKCDNEAAIIIGTTAKFSNRTKHIAVKFYSTQDAIKDQEIKLEYVATEDNISDHFTKPLDRQQFERFRQMMGIEAPPIEASNVGGVLGVSEAISESERRTRV